MGKFKRMEGKKLNNREKEKDQGKQNIYAMKAHETKKGRKQVEPKRANGSIA